MTNFDIVFDINVVSDDRDDMRSKHEIMKLNHVALCVGDTLYINTTTYIVQERSFSIEGEHVEGTIFITRRDK